MYRMKVPKFFPLFFSPYTRYNYVIFFITYRGQVSDIILEYIVIGPRPTDADRKREWTPPATNDNV